MFGSHILGGMKPLSEVEVKTREDIERIIKEVVDESSLASQVRVLIGKVGFLKKTNDQLQYEDTYLSC